MSLSYEHHLQIRAAVLHDLNQKFQMHTGQRIVSNALDSGAKFVFLQCGRKYGKTTFAVRKLIEHALLPTNHGTLNFHCVYERQQAKRIVWLSGVINKLANPKYIKQSWDTEMRIEFINGKQLIIDGSDNYRAHEGLEPAALVCDEFKNFNPKFWEAVEPNLAVYNPWVLFAGSPPGYKCQYREVAKWVQELEKEDGTGFFIKHPTWVNDKIPNLLEWLEKAKKRYVDRGEEYLFHREFGAEDIGGGKDRVFPDKVVGLNDPEVWRPNEWFKANLHRHAHKFDFYCIADPSHGGTFAVIFGAIDKVSKKIYLFDCIYQKNRALTGCYSMWEQIKEVLHEWNGYMDAWTFGYDDHEAWFPVEFNTIADGPNWMPSGKQTRGIQSGISLIKDAFLKKAVFINSDKLEPLKMEFATYQTNSKGEPERKNNDLIDTFRYLLYLSAWDAQEVIEEEVPEHIRNNPYLLTAFKQENQLENEALMDDWLHDMENDFVAYG
jgi:hypothetical protein